MDEKHRRAFIIAASADGRQRALAKQGTSAREFLNDFVANSDSLVDVGVKIVECYCLEDRQFNGFMLGVSLAVEFLDAVLSGPVDPHSSVSNALRD